MKVDDWGRSSYLNASRTNNVANICLKSYQVAQHISYITPQTVQIPASYRLVEWSGVEWNGGWRVKGEWLKAASNSSLLCCWRRDCSIVRRSIIRWTIFRVNCCRRSNRKDGGISRKSIQQFIKRRHRASRYSLIGLYNNILGLLLPPSWGDLHTYSAVCDNRGEWMSRLRDG